MQVPVGSGRGSSMRGGCPERADADAPVTRHLTRYVPWLADASVGNAFSTLLKRGGQGPFNPPLTSFDFTRSADR